ncbi:MAG TPA: tetratricopeptide repeat protein, partial [Candidatus Udaeobacter sp.]|nr:tetratricopeptide repeat protein [Candidatus Udaeobacter sp.]
DKGDPFAKAAAGDSLFAHGDFAGAETAYKEAVEIAKSYQAGLPQREEGLCVANYGLARIALQKKQPQDAEKLLGSCKDKPKYEGQYMLGMGLVRFDQANYPESERLLIQGSTRLDQAGGPPSSIRLEMAEKLVDVSYAKEEPLMAAQRLDDLAKLQPGQAAPFIKKGKILVEMKEYNDALNAFGMAIKADSTALVAYQEIAALYGRGKDPKNAAQAAQTLERAAAVVPRVDTYLAAAAAWDSLGQQGAAKALPLYEKALALDPQSSAAQIGKARAAQKSGDALAALDAFKAVPVASLSPADRKAQGEAAFAVGYGFYKEQNFAAAIPYFEQAVAADSTAGGAYSNLALCYLQTGRADEGIRMLEKAAALQPDDPKSRVWLAQALASQSQWDRAIEEYQKALQANPENADALRGLGFCLLNRQRYNEALEKLAQANRLDPQNAQGFIWQGQGLAMTERYAEAEAAFRQALAIDPASQDARSGLNQVVEVSKKTKK